VLLTLVPVVQEYFTFNAKEVMHIKQLFYAALTLSSRSHSWSGGGAWELKR
jgi:hypothetical protein